MDQASLRRKTEKLFGLAGPVDGILLLNTSNQDPNFVYMTDFGGGLFEDSFIVVERDVETLFTDMREYEGAKKQIIGGMRIVQLDSRKKVELLVGKIKGRRIGINGSFLPYSKYCNILKKWKPKKLVDVTDALSSAREVKEVYEIARIRKAAAITKKAIAMTQRQLRVGVTEKAIADYFNNAILKLGAEGTAFSSIVCFGENSAVPHHSPGSTRLRYGDIVLIDVGAKYRNYCADITRTVIFGKDRNRIRNYKAKDEMIRIVREAQDMAIASVHEGIMGSKVHMVAQDHIDHAAGGRYRGTFGHALGHSIGVEVHDGSRGFLSPGSTLKLKEGMVTSVEPGIYVPGLGGARIEDDILITKNGAVIL